MEYILGAKPADCIFCTKPAEVGREAENLILARLEHCFVILNAYPYNNGHLMVVPYQHASRLTELQDEVLHEMIQVTARSTQILQDAMRPQGFNVGLNLGAAAGAGMDEHLHLHIVPRWRGDTNFMPVVGHLKVIPETLSETWAKLRPLFALLEEEKP